MKNGLKHLVAVTPSIADLIHWLGAKVHVTLCVDLYSGRIIVFFYDLDDGLCFVICVIRFWT